jgi:hypothetical protein
MEKTGYIEIKVSGSNGNIELKPETYDIKDVLGIIEQAEKILFPGEKRERPLISYRMEEGSVRNIFVTSSQAIISIGAVLGQIQSSKSIDFLELDTARAIETFQETAIKKDFVFEIRTSLQNAPILKIDSLTQYFRTKEHWAEAEFYFYGKITNAGGKEKANIHLATEEYGILVIQTPQLFLANREENLLYKIFGIRARGKQNSETGEIDKSSLTFLELIDYNTIYDEAYLKDLRNKAKNWINDIDPDSWLRDIRGYDA